MVMNVSSRVRLSSKPRLWYLLTVCQDSIREAELTGSIPYTYQEQAGIHKHKLETHRNRLKSLSVSTASDLVGVNVLQKPTPSFSGVNTGVREAGASGGPAASHQ